MPINGDGWAQIIRTVYELDNRPMPARDEMERLVKSWRMHVGVSIDSVEEAVARVQDFYASGKTFMKPMDRRPAPKLKSPADRGLAEATGQACPWPDECDCTHSGGCVAGWIEVDPDGFRQGERERGSELRREAAQRGLGLQAALSWAGTILRAEFGPPPAPGSGASPCPRCRPDQFEIVSEELSRDAAMIRLRKRSKR